jgi:hypothetical protein
VIQINSGAAENPPGTVFGANVPRPQGNSRSISATVSKSAITTGFTGRVKFAQVAVVRPQDRAGQMDLAGAPERRRRRPCGVVNDAVALTDRQTALTRQ